MDAWEVYKDLVEGSDDFTPYKDRIMFRVIPKAKAEEQELAMLNLYDMAIVFEIRLAGAEIILTDEEGSEKRSIKHAYAMISEQQADRWETTPAELYEYALENTQKARPVWKGSLIERMCQMCPEIQVAQVVPDDHQDPIRIITNEDGYHGFAALFYPGVLEDLYRELGSFWIIPSSVHEAMILQKNMYLDPEFLKRIIQQTNMEVVSEKERLSDSLFCYNPETMELEICRGVVQ